MNDTRNVNMLWAYTIGCLARVTFNLICDCLTLLLLGLCAAFFGWIVQVENNRVRTCLDSSSVLKLGSIHTGQGLLFEGQLSISTSTSTKSTGTSSISCEVDSLSVTCLSLFLFLPGQRPVLAGRTSPRKRAPRTMPAEQE